MCQKSNKNKIAQIPNTDLYRVKTVPGAIKSLIRDFAPLLLQIRRNRGPDPFMRTQGPGDRKVRLEPMVRTQYMYTTTGFVPRTDKKMAGVYHFLMYYMYKLRYCGIWGQFAYATRHVIHQPFPFF